jgi:single-stranded-DNA-specific exonuclease
LASRVKDRLHRPTFAFARGENGEIKGSGRSIPGLHLRDALDLLSKRAPGLLRAFGGHAAAAGATLLEKDFTAFRELFIQVAAELMAPEALTQSVETDGALEMGHHNLEVAHLLESQIWGQGFPAPLFDAEFIVERQRVLKEKHLKLNLKKDGQVIEGIQFNFTQQPGSRAHVVYRLEVNDYNGIQSPQLLIESLEAL